MFGGLAVGVTFCGKVSWNDLLVFALALNLNDRDTWLAIELGVESRHRDREFFN